MYCTRAILIGLVTTYLNIVSIVFQFDLFCSKMSSCVVADLRAWTHSNPEVT